MLCEKMKRIINLLALLALVCFMALTSGCMGTAHGYRRCGHADGRYFRATRMNYNVLVGRETVNASVTVRNGIRTETPGWSLPVRLPFVIIDFPFGLVLDTVLVPFIASGVVHEPGPYFITPDELYVDPKNKQQDAQHQPAP